MPRNGSRGHYGKMRTSNWPIRFHDSSLPYNKGSYEMFAAGVWFMEFVCRLLPERGVWFFSWSKILLGLEFVSPHWADRETHMGLQNIYLGYLYSHVHYMWWLYLCNSVSRLPTRLQAVYSCRSWIQAVSKFLIKAVQLSKDELGSLLFIYACKLSLINYIIYSIHNRIFLEVLIYLFPQRFGQFYCPSSRRNYNL